MSAVTIFLAKTMDLKTFFFTNLVLNVSIGGFCTRIAYFAGNICIKNTNIKGIGTESISTEGINTEDMSSKVICAKNVYTKVIDGTNITNACTKDAYI